MPWSLKSILTFALKALFTVGLALPLLAQAQTQSLSKIKTNTWDIALSSDQRSSTTAQSQVVSFDGRATVQYELNEFLNLGARGGFSLQTGSSHSTLNPAMPESGLVFDYAQMNIRPLSFFEFSGGALNQSQHSNPLLVTNRAFPAAQLSLLTENDELSLKTYFQSAIPTSQQFSSQTSDREPLPHFHIGAITGKYTVGSNTDPDFQISVLGGKWKFEGLPSRVASESIVLGNTIIQSAPGLAKFAYQFEGLTASVETQARIYNRLKGFLSARGHKNEKAPAGSNEGRAFTIGFQYLTVDNISIRPQYAIFQNQSDAGPGYYSSSDLGNNNRKGEVAGLNLDFKKSGFAINTEYANTQEIFDNPAQESNQSLMFYLEIKNASI